MGCLRDFIFFIDDSSFKRLAKFSASGGGGGGGGESPESVSQQ